MAGGEFELAYKQREPLYHRLLVEALSILRLTLKQEKVPVATISGRVKTLESSLAKSERDSLLKGSNPGHVLDSFCDMVGTRVVCPFPANIEEVKCLVTPVFEVLGVDDKIAAYADSPTGYQSLHMTLRLCSDYAGPRYDGIKHIRFELQVRTICMDAWANVSHQLAYKNENDATPEIRADFRALSGLFYVADKEFGRLAELSGTATKRLRQEYQDVRPRFLKEDVTIESLGAYLQQRFPGRKDAPRKILAELAEELRDAGITTIGGLEKFVVRMEDKFHSYEAKNPPSNGPQFTNVGVIRAMFRLDRRRGLPRPT